jgi:hypothetical protein
MAQTGKTKTEKAKAVAAKAVAAKAEKSKAKKSKKSPNKADSFKKRATEVHRGDTPVPTPGISPEPKSRLSSDAQPTQTSESQKVRLKVCLLCLN